MRIAICDDEDQERLNIKALVKRYAPELSIVLFSSADELLTAAKTTFFPLIFLDIEMDDTNGFDAAEELMSGSSQPLIVFVTAVFFILLEWRTVSYPCTRNSVFRVP